MKYFHHLPAILVLFLFVAISAFALSLITLANGNIPGFVPFLLALDTVAAAAITYDISSDLEETQKNKIAYIENGLFAAKQKEYAGSMTRSRSKAEADSMKPPRLGYR